MAQGPRNTTEAGGGRRGVELEPSQAIAGLSLLFAAGERPSASHLEWLLASESHVSSRVRVTYRSEEAEGWLELLVNGLTFDLTGLSPSSPDGPPPMEHQFGLSLDVAKFDFEAITLAPAAHIAGGRAMIPVVRTMVGLATDISSMLPVKAICWHPVGSWMEPAYFSRVVANWLSGGAFPALGLAAVRVDEAGIAESVGLEFFAGQEVRVEAVTGEPRAETVKRAVRIIDYIVRHGSLEALLELQEADGEPVLAEPSRDGRQVRVWRSV